MLQAVPLHSTISLALAIKSVLLLFFHASAPSVFEPSPMPLSNSSNLNPTFLRFVGFVFNGSTM